MKEIKVLVHSSFKQSNDLLILKSQNETISFQPIMKPIFVFKNVNEM